MDDDTLAILVAGGILVAGIYIYKDDIKKLLLPENEHDKNVDDNLDVISGHQDELTEEELEAVTERTKDKLDEQKEAGILTEEEYEEAISYIDEKGLVDGGTVVNLIDDVVDTIESLRASGDLTQEGYEILLPKAKEARAAAIVLNATIEDTREENKKSNDPGYIARLIDSIANSLIGHKTLAAVSCATVAAMYYWLRRGRPGSKWLIYQIRKLDNPDDPLEPGRWKTRPIPTFSYTYTHPDTVVDFNPHPIIDGVSINPEVSVTTIPEPTDEEVETPENTPELTSEQWARWLRFKEFFEEVFRPGHTTQTVYPLIEPYLPEEYQNLIDPNDPPDAITFIGNFLPDDIKYNYDENNQIKWFVNNGMWWMVDRFIIAVIGAVTAISVAVVIFAPEVAAAIGTFTTRLAPYVVFAI